MFSTLCYMFFKDYFQHYAIWALYKKFDFIEHLKLLLNTIEDLNWVVKNSPKN